MKTIFIALGMAVVLFFYGYVSSTVGHDHDDHGRDAVEEDHHNTEGNAHHH